MYSNQSTSLNFFNFKINHFIIEKTNNTTVNGMKNIGNTKKSGELLANKAHITKIVITKKLNVHIIIGFNFAKTHRNIPIIEPIIKAEIPTGLLKISKIAITASNIFFII